MKHNLIIALVAILLPLTAIWAQDNSKKFTGSITYKVTYPAAASNPMISALPNSITMQIAGNKAMMEVVLPFGKNTLIINGDDFTMTRLVDLEKGKYFVRKTKEDFNTKSDAVFVPLKEIKKIAGQNCKAMEVNGKDQNGKSTKTKIFYSDELGVNNIYFNTGLKAIKGIMLEGDYMLMGIPVQLSAVSVNPGRVSNKVFEIPSGYTETTEAKLREMRGPIKK
jgi:hypothetical protein